MTMRDEAHAAEPGAKAVGAEPDVAPQAGPPAEEPAAGGQATVPRTEPLLAAAPDAPAIDLGSPPPAPTEADLDYEPSEESAPAAQVPVAPDTALPAAPPIEHGPQDTGPGTEDDEAEPPLAPRTASAERRAVVLRPPSFGAVEAHGLVKFYGTTAALRGCDLMVLRGERVALLGANGAGKTTLLKLLATLVRPSAGHLTILGHDAVRQAGQVRRYLGVVAHETYLYRDLTAAENLRLYGRLYAVAELEARITAELERVGLAELRERRVGTLSRGQQQRLALARALLHAPSLLLLDEPDTGLDEAGQALLGRVVREAAPTVVLATHSVERAVTLADRVVVLAAGKVAYEAACGALDPVRLHKALGGVA